MKELFVGIRIVRNLFVSDIKAFVFFRPGAVFFFVEFLLSLYTEKKSESQSKVITYRWKLKGNEIDSE